MKHPLVFPITDADKQRFFRKCGPPDKNGCREFLGGRCEGYGRFWLQGETRQAHYVAFAIAKGRVPMKDVLQGCRNKLCCESSHLFEGIGSLTTERNLRERFEAKFVKLSKNHPTLPGPCWEWTGSKDEAGYATMRYQGRQRRASHLSLLIYKGETRELGLDGCHECDYPLCVNPDHIRFDTPGGNGHDKVIRNRTAKGRKNGAYTKHESRRVGILNGRRVLTDRAVCVIRRTFEAHPGKRGLQAALARKFRVDASTIDAVQRREKWKHLAEDAFPKIKALAIAGLCHGRAKG